MGKIARIERVHNLSLKSWNAYTGPDDTLTFKGNTIIFGQNGSGKSSLAIGIKDEAKSMLSSPENVSLFNSDYVRDSILMEDDHSSIKGVSTQFGQQNITIHHDIERLENEKLQLQKQIDTTAREQDNLRESVKSKIDTIFEETKGTQPIRQKSGNKQDIQNIIEKWKNDYEEGNKQFPNYAWDEVKGNESLSKKYESIK
ncbi:MAG: AAA family ATPase, partial [Streptococcus gallolyticus]|nr:AAA family ATPase [Streptococcus gallolyticus]